MEGMYECLAAAHYMCDFTTMPLLQHMMFVVHTPKLHWFVLVTTHATMILSLGDTVPLKMFIN